MKFLGFKYKTKDGVEGICDDIHEILKYNDLDDIDSDSIKLRTNLKDKNGIHGYIDDYWMNDAGSKFKLTWNEETSSLKLYDDYFHCVNTSATPKHIKTGIFIKGDS